MPRLLPLFMVATFAACENEVPTALDEGLLPVKPVTLEVRLPWSQFATRLPRSWAASGGRMRWGWAQSPTRLVGRSTPALCCIWYPRPTDSVVDNTIVDIAGDTLTDDSGRRGLAPL